MRRRGEKEGRMDGRLEGRKGEYILVWFEFQLGCILIQKGFGYSIHCLRFLWQVIIGISIGWTIVYKMPRIVTSIAYISGRRSFRLSRPLEIRFWSGRGWGRYGRGRGGSRDKTPGLIMACNGNICCFVDYCKNLIFFRNWLGKKGRKQNWRYERAVSEGKEDIQREEMV